MPRRLQAFPPRLADYCLIMQNGFLVGIVNSYVILPWQNGSNLPNVSSSTPMKLI